MRLALHIALLMAVIASVKCKRFFPRSLPRGLLNKKNIRSGSKSFIKSVSSGAAKGMISTTLADGIGRINHHGDWNLDYYDQKHQMTQAALNIINHEIEEITGALEMMEERFQTTSTNNIIMKSVLFVAVGALAGGFIWLALKMKNNIYLKRMQSLISSLAGLKNEYKSKINIVKAKQDIHDAHLRQMETEENFSLMQSNLGT